METKVKVEAVKYASKEEEKAFLAAARQYEIELNDSDFWYDVAMKYDSWTHKKSVGNIAFGKRDQTFAEFKEMVLDGANKYFNVIDYIISISVTFYYSWRSVVGYTKPSTWWTWVNRNIFKGFDLGDIAGNQSHEELHNEGLDHPGTDRNSVVYQFGYLIRDRIKKRLKLESTINIHYRRSFWTRVKRFFGRIF